MCPTFALLSLLQVDIDRLRKYSRSIGLAFQVRSRLRFELHSW